jgi:hypothetical protein
MKVESAISKWASELVGHLHKLATGLEPEKFGIEARLREIEAINKAARLAPRAFPGRDESIVIELGIPG